MIISVGVQARVSFSAGLRKNLAAQALLPVMIVLASFASFCFLEQIEGSAPI